MWAFFLCLAEARGFIIPSVPSKTKYESKLSILFFGGSERIRTSETVTRPHDFESCAFNHSATLPPPILSYFYPKNKATTIEHMVASLKILSCRFHIYVPEFPRPLFIGRILSVGTLRSPHVFGHLPYTFSLNFSTFRDR